MPAHLRGLQISHRLTAFAITVVAAFGSPVLQPTLDAQDDPPLIRYSRELTYGRVEMKLFKSTNVFNTAWREATQALRVRIHEHKLKRKWMNVEMHAFHRLAGHIDTELVAVTEARKNLQTASFGAAQFGNGDDWPTKRGAFIKLLRQVGHTDEARAMLQQAVQPQPAENFYNHSYLNLVDGDGNLSNPPKTLTDRSIEGRGIELFRDFRDEWQHAVVDLKEGRLIGSGQTERMHAMLNEWDDVRGTIRGMPSVAGTSYLERAGLLVTTMEQTEGRMELGDFLRNKGHQFRGKTVGEMMRHVLEHDLVVAPGSDAHIALGTVTNALVQVAKDEAAELTARIDVLKSQSPSHNAAIRQKLIPLHLQEYRGKHAGMDSRAFSQVAKPSPVKKAAAQQD